MTKRFMMVLALLLMAVSLLSGGCSQTDSSKIQSWKDLIKIPSTVDKATPTNKETPNPVSETPLSQEKITVKLYFLDSGRSKLVVEERSIVKTEGIARQTMQELLKGPAQQGLQAVVPAGTRLLDINVKPEGLCIVDLSSDVNKISSKDQGKLMVQAIANTLAQFPSVAEVSFLINGEKANTLGGLVDVAQPVAADYSI